MKRTITLIAMGAVALVLVIVVILGVFLATLDLNNYKGNVEKAVEKATGRHVVFEGDFTHSFFPLGLKTGPAYIRDEDMYGPEPLLSMKGISLNANLLALIKGDIIIDKLTLHDLTIKLAVSATGEKNWEHARKIAGSNVTPLAEEGDTNADRSAISVIEDISGGITKKKRLHFQIKSITAENSRVIYRNLQNNTTWTLDKSTATVTNAGMNREMAIALAGSLIVNNHPANANLRATARMSYDDMVQATISSFSIKNQDHDGPLPELSGSALLLYDSNLKNLSINDLKGSFANTPFSGVLSVMLPESPNLNSGTACDVRGEIHLGSINVKNIQTKFQALASLPSRNALTAKRTTSKTNSNEEKSIRSFASDKGLPFFSRMFAAIDATAKSIIFDNIVLSEVTAKPLLSESKLDMPVTFSCFGGKVQGKLSSSVIEKGLPWHVTANARGIKVEQLPFQLAKEHKLSGNIRAKADLSGNSSTQAIPSLQGNISLAMDSGQVRESVLIPRIIREQLVLPENYPIETASFSAQIKNSVATTSDIRVISPDITVTGKGTLHLIKKTIAFDMEAKDKKKNDLPFLIRGTLDSPKFSLDIKKLSSNALKENLHDEAKKVLNKLENLKKPKQLLQKLFKKKSK